MMRVLGMNELLRTREVLLYGSLCDIIDVV